jgi:Tol biopolymer transport system component
MRKSVPLVPTSGGGSLLPAYLWALLVATVVATCVLLVGRSEPAKAAFPGENGRIAFVGRVEGISDQIFAIKPDGTGEKQLTTSPRSYNITPSYSSDGSKIAWERNGDIWIMNADGTNRHSLTTSPAGDASPAFSPDGRRLVFERFLYATEGYRIETIRADGTGLRIVFEHSTFWASDPVFSPDGTKIAFRYELGHDIWKINPDGTGLTDVTNTPDRSESSPDWRPMPTATTTR